MTADLSAFADRLFADAIAAPLHDRSGFLTGARMVTVRDVEEFVRLRLGVYERDLSASPALAERALGRAWECWRPLAAGSEDAESFSILPMLWRAGRALLQPHGSEMILRAHREEPGREILRWRFVSLSIPPGILLAATAVDGRRTPSGVRLLHASFAPDHPVAQQHLHHAAMISFEDLWASVRFQSLVTPAQLERNLRRERALCPGLHEGPCLRGRQPDERLAKKRPADSARHMSRWAHLLRQAFIARRVLDSHGNHAGPFGDCEHEVCRSGRRFLAAFMAGAEQASAHAGVAYPFGDEIDRLARRERLFAELVSTGRGDTPCRGFLHEQAAEERQILRRAFIYVRRAAEGSGDALFDTLFLQYLRVKTALYRLLVHPPGERGLENFLEHFQQIAVYEPSSSLRRPSPPHEPGLDVRSTEYRVAPNAWLDELGRSLGRIETSARTGAAEHDAAWLIHFKRDKPVETLPLYGSVVQAMEAEAARVGNLLEQDPRRLRTLRGIDICGVEDRQPLWVSAQTLRKLRARSSRIAGDRPGLGVRALKLTLHAGEDFRWLTSGTRAVAEPFFWNLIERGDRIGHGLALTLDPAEWWQRHEGDVVCSTMMDRLLDLAFLASHTDTAGGSRDPARTPSVRDEPHTQGRSPDQERWLREELETVLSAMRFDADGEDPIQTAIEFWRALGGPPGRRLMTVAGRPDGPPHERWVHRYLWSRSTRKRAAETIRLLVDRVATERDLLIKARRRLIRTVARWQVSIESNPSSNLVVGSLDAMASQDFLARRPTQVAEAEETLTWTISTDDPITFSTSLADEYAYAWAGMVLRAKDPYDPAYARALLDEAARTSMRTRFTEGA